MRLTTYIAFNSVLLVTASKVVRRLLQRTGDMIWKPLSAISRFFTDAVRKISPAYLLGEPSTRTMA